MSNYHIDYETYSDADLTKVGAYRYAEDPSTEVLMLAVGRDDGGVKLWLPPAYRDCAIHESVEAEALIAELAADPAALVWAHNAQFERAISTFSGFKLLRFMADRPRDWRCTAALCRKANLPNALEKAATYLQLADKKDASGKALIRKFAGRITAGKRKGDRLLPSDDPEAFEQFGRYCRTDVEVERQLHAKLKGFELEGVSLEAFLCEGRINDLGIPVNLPALRHAQSLIDEIETSKFAAFKEKTGLSPTQKKAFREWLAEHGVALDNMQGDTVKGALEGLTPSDAQEALLLYSELNYSAVKKIKSMLACANEDGRVRGTLLFEGTGPGRFSANLIQPQNFKKPSVKNTDLAYTMICGGASVDDIDLIFGNPYEVISSTIRHFIDAGSPLLDGDYAGLQARVINWLAGQGDALERFRQNVDPYRVLASYIFNVPAEDIGKPSRERDIGKEGELGCGFGLGVGGFLNNCHVKRKMGWVTKEMASKTVKAYRETHRDVVRFWAACEKAARDAILKPGIWFPAGKLCAFSTRRMGGVNYLLGRLPSGRCISFVDPKIETWHRYDKVTKEVIDSKKDSITYYGKPTTSTGGSGNIFLRVPTYGGKLAQNMTMGVEADIVSIGTSNCFEAGYEPFTLIHDQGLCVKKTGQNIDQFCELLTDLPEWAEGLPIVADGGETPYYQKT